MAESFYGLEHPNPNKSQIGDPRRGGNEPSGVHVIHTAECLADLKGADTAAEGVAGYISRRDSYGSYHRIFDSDSIVKYAPFGLETWHCIYTNPWSVGLSFAVQAHKWDDYPRWFVDEIIAQGAKAAAESIRDHKKYWGVDVPLRRITRAQALRKVPGFLGHGETDPWRRSDPGDDFPWTKFFNAIRRELGQAEVDDDADEGAKKPKPTPDDDFDRIAEDGKWGSDTTRRKQQELKEAGWYDGPVDGEIWYQNPRWKDDNPGCTLGWDWDRNYRRHNGSKTIRADQKRLRQLGLYHDDIDGLAGPNYFSALQLEQGTTVDGEIWKPSACVEAMQRDYNNGRIA